ncbi:MAG: Dna[CI] antecedent, DciA [Acidobacteriota bacterium]|jgi:predicted nucleic acid-binding Zn ribbon protein
MIPLNNFAAGVLADLVRRQPASKERTAFAWQLAVGPALARATSVELDGGGILTVRGSDPRWVAEIDRARDGVLLKMQHLLGRDQITRIRTR